MSDFQIVQTGADEASENRPPAELLKGNPDGTQVRGPDGVLWRIAAAQPRRWVRVKTYRRGESAGSTAEASESAAEASEE